MKLAVALYIVASNRCRELPTFRVPRGLASRAASVANSNLTGKTFRVPFDDHGSSFTFLVPEVRRRRRPSHTREKKRGGMKKRKKEMTWCPCAYARVLGEPGKGVHVHVFGIAVVDVLLTLAGGYVWTASALSKEEETSSARFAVTYVSLTTLLATIGVVMHRLFCVRTTVDKWLFPDDDERESPPP